ncbi:MAG TPA: hypothetical protein VF177_09285 [Anaerolineae bacterium]
MSPQLPVFGPCSNFESSTFNLKIKTPFPYWGDGVAIPPNFSLVRRGRFSAFRPTEVGTTNQTLVAADNGASRTLLLAHSQSGKLSQGRSRVVLAAVFVTMAFSLWPSLSYLPRQGIHRLSGYSSRSSLWAILFGMAIELG